MVLFLSKTTNQSSRLTRLGYSINYRNVNINLCRHMYHTSNINNTLNLNNNSNSNSNNKNNNINSTGCTLMVNNYKYSNSYKYNQIQSQISQRYYSIQVGETIDQEVKTNATTTNATKPVSYTEEVDDSTTELNVEQKEEDFTLPTSVLEKFGLSTKTGSQEYLSKQLKDKIAIEQNEKVKSRAYYVPWNENEEVDLIKAIAKVVFESKNRDPLKTQSSKYVYIFCNLML